MMRRLLFGFILAVMAASAVAQMLWQPSAESDALFAAGVDLYNAGKYREAIPLFAKSDSLDKAQIDPSSNRRDYSSMWLASCYYQLGDTATAAGIDTYYRFAPVDRRLTVKSDSLSQIGMEYANQGDYAKAIEYLTQCAEIEKSVLGDSCVWYCNSLWNIFDCYYQAGDMNNALKYNEVYVNRVRIVCGKLSRENLISTANLGLLYHQLSLCDSALNCLIYAYSHLDSLDLNKQYLAYHIANEYNIIASEDSTENKMDLLQKARSYLKKADANDSIVYQLHTDVEKNIALCLSAEALKQARKGDYKEALLISEEVAGIIEKAFGKGNTDYATSLHNLASYNADAGNYAEAISLEAKALQIYEKVLGRKHRNYILSLNSLMLYNSSLENYSEAMHFGTEALQLSEEVLGKYSTDYATLLHNLGSCNFLLGNYEEAIRLKTEALQIFGEILGEENLEYAVLLSDISSYNTYLDNYSEAIRLGTEALRIKEKVLGKEHLEYAVSLSNLANCYFLLDNYEESVRLEKEALNIREKTLGKDHSDCATSLSNLAYYNSYLGNYEESVRLEKEALNIREKTLGKEHSDCAISLSNLACYNFYLGNYVESVRLEKEALNIREKTLGKEHPAYATSLNNLAAYNNYLGNYKEAILLGAEALIIREKVFGIEHSSYSIALSNLAIYNLDLGNYSEAIRLGAEALRIKEKVLGKEHSGYAVSLSNLGYSYLLLGNYAKAIQFEREALRVKEKIYNKTHPRYAMSLKALAVYYHKINKLDAIKYCVEATEALSGIVRRTFADLTARDRNLFWEQYKTWFEGTIHSIAYDMPSDSLAENGYNGALMAKGLLLNSEMELSELLKESGDEGVANIYNNLKNLRLQINKLYEMPIAERLLDTDSLERAAQGLERQLVQRSKAYGDYTANLVIDWKQVRQRLGSGEMAVEFVSFPLRNGSVMYAAYCLRKDMASPKMVPLFEERQLTSMDKRLYLSSPMLYNLIWKPLEKEMKGVTTVYFAPAGELYNLPIENLPVGEGTYNSDIRGYRRLSSTRQLALHRNGVEVAKAAVYGGLKYDTDTVTLANDSRKYRTAEPVQWSSRTVADSLNLRDGVYELPATRIEAEDIDKALESAKINTELYTDTLGTEASFKALSGSGVNALHIATHGFYWTEREAAQLDGLAFLSTDMPTVVQEDKALTRSGLLLAGANTALKGLPLPDGVEDGVLTAKEIAGMDLRRLDLVALSACQTGLGEITGDGVFGLQRGFKKAGANTLLMSLWKVDDTATQLLMTQFYKNMLSGMGKYEALAAAQKYLRELEVEVKPEKTAFQQIMDGKDGKKEKIPEHRTVRKYANPYYWAAFVLLDGVD